MQVIMQQRLFFGAVRMHALMHCLENHGITPAGHHVHRYTLPKVLPSTEAALVM